MSASTIKKIILKTESTDLDTETISLHLKVPKREGYVNFIASRGELEDPNLFMRLRDKGYLGNRATWKKEAKILSDAVPRSTILTTSKTGVIKNCLVTRFKNYSWALDQSELVVYRDPNEAEVQTAESLKNATAESSGTAEEFYEGISEQLLAAPILVLTYLAALAAPLLPLVGHRPGMMFLLYGETSTGKSTALRLAQSVATACKNDTDLTSFSGTQGQLLQSLKSAPGVALCFGDVKANRDTNAMFEIIRTIAYAALEGRLRRTQKERNGVGHIDPMVILMSSEKTLGSFVTHRSSNQLEDSDLFRVIHIPVPTKDEGGIFANDAENKLEHINKLERILNEQHGTVYRDWVDYLTKQDRQELSELFKGLLAKSISGFELVGHVEQRIQDTFKVLWAIAKIASKSGHLPITLPEAKRALLFLCSGAKAELNRPTKAALNSQQVLELLTDPTRFPMAEMGKDLKFDPALHLGFRRKEGAKTKLYVVGSHFKLTMHQIPTSDVEAALQDLVNSGLGSKFGKEYTNPVAQKGIGRPRCYQLDWEALLSKRANGAPS